MAFHLLRSFCADKSRHRAPGKRQHGWLKNNANLSQPPVDSFCLHSEDGFILMVLGGPNALNHYHVNETEVCSMLLRIIEVDEIRDVHIKEGGTFFLPTNTPHSPVRYSHAMVFTSHCVELGTRVQSLVKEWQNNEALRTGKTCIQVQDLE
ncbi:hypothetical protein DOTSEDRAFT_61954 [Dothistroma septosporum NZE10]|uniref:3-hydroxyanthranilate 3,4-dioxygenase n=1 Tax=Dothistroma septosporum (strain NZE10 / CBS 128990) TaxID=675120 RepID=N1PST4_DOTSN|nr:hypothetical protein DOTSEDRAFT_61954 [Dothistroma septosporum NZE10]